MTTKGGGDEARQRREARLAAELRANLQRRKQQARSRREGEADERPDGLAASASPPDRTDPSDERT